jgi:hypothetical protein
VVHVRRSCTDEQSEVACGESTGAGDAVVTGLFDPGAYTVFADAQEQDVTGRYSIEVDVAPPAGSGVSGDSCADATTLVASASISGDTFAARDDVAGSCGGAGAPDVVYRVDLAKRSRLSVTVQSEEARHTLVVWRRCGDRSTEVACGREIDEVLAPGTYFLAVDGSSEEAMGRFTLSWSARDLSVQSAACLAAPTLIEGHPVSGSTVGTIDKFNLSCLGHDTANGGSDRVYKLAVPKRSRVQVTLTAASFEAALALRRACQDISGGAHAAEVACEADSDVGQRTVIDRTLEAGTYWVVVDGQTANEQGPFTLEYRAMR